MAELVASIQKSPRRHHNTEFFTMSYSSKELKCVPSFIKRTLGKKSLRINTPEESMFSVPCDTVQKCVVYGKLLGVLYLVRNIT